MSSQLWPNGLFFASELRMYDLDERRLCAAVDRGALVRVKRGAYVRGEHWTALTDTRRHELRARAVNRSDLSPVFSHWSAAVIHGLPLVGGIPDTVHVIGPRATGGRSEVGVRRHSLGLEADEWMLVAGMRVTTVARTIADLAATQPFRFALAPADEALRLHRTTRAQLADAVARLTRGHARARRVLEAASGSSASPGESLSRGTIAELGFPAPLLQVRHPFAGGLDITDFEWPEYGLLGEFDGFGKYLREELRGGASPGEVVVAEKLREDRLRRSTGGRMARWGWTEALRAQPLRDILLDAGLPLVRAAASRNRAR